MDPIRSNELLDALLALKPLPPGPEWQTAHELHAAAKAKGEEIALSAVKQRLAALVKAGNAETKIAPRRGIGTGQARYYKCK